MITENLQIIKDSTLAIKQAIIDKGGEIDGDITTYADLINNLSSGGSGGSSEEGQLNFDGVVEDFTNAHYNEVKHLIIKHGVETMSDPTGMGYGAFEWPNIESVELPDTLRSISAYAFFGAGLKKVIIPNSVIHLGSYCFSNTDSLEYVVMPNALEEMDWDGEFDGSSVEYIYFNNATIIPNIQWSFSMPPFPRHTKIIVPDTLYDQWINANHWSNCADQIYRASEYPIPNE